MADEGQQPTGQQYSFAPGEAVLFTETWWRERGLAAAEASKKLDEIALAANGLLRTNNLGHFVEGEQMHAQFQKNIEYWVATLQRRSKSATNLAAACYDAAKIVAADDHEAASGIVSARTGTN